MKRFRKPESIGSILESVLADRGYLSVCREQEVKHRWCAVVGERIAAVAECTRVERGIVYVRVASAAWRQELAYLKPMLLGRIRKQCASIKDVVFI